MSAASGIGLDTTLDVTDLVVIMVVVPEMGDVFEGPDFIEPNGLRLPPGPSVPENACHVSIASDLRVTELRLAMLALSSRLPVLTCSLSLMPVIDLATKNWREPPPLWCHLCSQHPLCCCHRGTQGGQRPVRGRAATQARSPCLTQNFISRNSDRFPALSTHCFLTSGSPRTSGAASL